MDPLEKTQRPKVQSYFRFLWPGLISFISCIDGWLWAANFVLTGRDRETQRETEANRENGLRLKFWRSNPEQN